MARMITDMVDSIANPDVKIQTVSVIQLPNSPGKVWKLKGMELISYANVVGAIDSSVSGTVRLQSIGEDLSTDGYAFSGKALSAAQLVQAGYDGGGFKMEVLPFAVGLESYDDIYLQDGYQLELCLRSTVGVTYDFTLATSIAVELEEVRVTGAIQNQLITQLAG